MTCPPQRPALYRSRLGTPDLTRLLQLPILFHARNAGPGRKSMSKRSLLFILLIATGATAGYAQDAWKGHQPTLTPQQSGTTQLLIAVSPVNSQIVWAA